MFRHRLRRMQGERGASLILAMGFLALLGILVSSLLSVTYSSVKTTGVARGSQAKLYGADGAIDYAVETIENDDSYCPSGSSGTQSLPDLSLNGRTVTVTCQLVDSTSSGFSFGWTSLTGYNNPDGTTPQKNDLYWMAGTAGTTSDQIKFQGTMFNAGKFKFDSASPTTYIADDLHQYDSPGTNYCTADKAAAIKPTVAGSWDCEDPDDYDEWDWDDVDIEVSSTTAKAKKIVGSCHIMYPGRYTTAPTFTAGTKYYFASGTYYFHNVGEITLRGEIFGGQPWSFLESKLMTNASPCATDSTAESQYSGGTQIDGYGVSMAGSPIAAATVTTTCRRCASACSLRGTPSAVA